jgi:predicted regulator of Ras-like GTPase activity (Roadblock/LC7/MglB family)
VDEASALADLREIAPQLRTLVLLDADGVPIASTADDPVELGAAVARLLEAAKSVRPGGDRGVERLHVATGAGSVFAVTSAERTLAALGPADATPDLAFYDLRTALDRLTNGAPA